jgi:hypothetical protein
MQTPLVAVPRVSTGILIRMSEFLHPIASGAFFCKSQIRWFGSSKTFQPPPTVLINRMLASMRAVATSPSRFFAPDPWRDIIALPKADDFRSLATTFRSIIPRAKSHAACHTMISSVPRLDLK